MDPQRVPSTFNYYKYWALWISQVTFFFLAQEHFLTAQIKSQISFNGHYHTTATNFFIRTVM